MKRVLVNQRDDVAQDVRWDAPFAEFGEILIYLPVYKKDDGKIVLRSWDPKSLSLASLDKPRRKRKPSPGVFVIVRAAWSCPNIAPCLTRALKTWPIPAGPIVWTDHSVMHCSEKRKHERWSLWLPMTDNKNTRAHWVGWVTCFCQFLPRWIWWQWWRDRAQGRKEQRQSTTCLGNPGPWHSQSVASTCVDF